jgi:NADP-dependent 3-hydroxy acid dehydrogenase YdfG
MNKNTSYVIVTGGSGGIGDAICRRLNQDGYKVLNLDVREPESPDASEFFEVDLFDVEKTRKTLETVVAKYPVTRLVNNVGIVRPASVTDSSLADFDDVGHQCQNNNDMHPGTAARYETKSVRPNCHNFQPGSIGKTAADELQRE